MDKLNEQLKTWHVSGETSALFEQQLWRKIRSLEQSHTDAPLEAFFFWRSPRYLMMTALTMIVALVLGVNTGKQNFRSRLETPILHNRTLAGAYLQLTRNGDS